MNGRTIRLVLFGPTRVGKTSYIKRFLTDKFDPEYIPTIGYGYYKGSIETFHGKIDLDILDGAGYDPFILYRYGLNVNADGAISFLDVFDENKMTTSLRLEENFRIVNPAPIIRIASKADIFPGNVKPLIYKSNAIPTSAAFSYNIDVPIRILLNRIFTRSLIRTIK